ncbi:MAG TPA: multicopper oxidase domain-containing protein [Candidatus Angelobacter sp.]|nr:multicopper oxidase domain-containing protein [Candidatus Angelobacter sp.]
MGAAAGVATVLTSRKSLAYSLPTPPPEPTDCALHPPNSPPTRPFVQALPIPPIAIPTRLNPQPTKSANLAAGEAPRADHQFWDRFFPFVQYDVTIQGGLHQFHPDMPPTYIWGYNGIYPGPTFLNVYGVPVVVRFHNNLPVNHQGFGTNTHTTHLHNGHTGSESDGFAEDFWGPGFFKDHHYLNVYAGFQQLGGIGDPLEAQFTYWYHDHRHSFTATNNYRGLNGMYLAFNEKDTGFEFSEQGEEALRLPGIDRAGVSHDIPLHLTDKSFCTNGQMFVPAPDAAPAGDKFIVNGVIQPFLQVNRRKYRFRILNSGPARIYTLNVNDNNGNVVPFQVVATDGNLLPSPVTIPDPLETAIASATLAGGPGLQVHVSSRYDVVIDFSNSNIGDHWYLSNIAPQFVNNAPEPDNDAVAPGLEVENVVMRFDIVGDEFDESRVPDVLTALPDISGPLANLAATRTWNFNNSLVGPKGDPGNPAAPKIFNINGLTFDAARADATMAQGSAETWLLRSRFPGAAWHHPVHIHLEEGRVLDRRTVQVVNGVRTITNHFVPPLQRGRRDVYPIGGGDEILVFLQFRDLFGKYMIHCHNLAHEDGLMLTRWDVGTTTSTSTSAVYSDGTANTGTVVDSNGVSQAVPDQGGQPNITPALTTLSDSFDLGSNRKPSIGRSKKGVNA